MSGRTKHVVEVDADFRQAERKAKSWGQSLADSVRPVRDWFARQPGGYDDSANRYRDPTTGRFVAQKKGPWEKMRSYADRQGANVTGTVAGSAVTADARMTRALGQGVLKGIAGTAKHFGYAMPIPDMASAGFAAAMAVRAVRAQHQYQIAQERARFDMAMARARVVGATGKPGSAIDLGLGPAEFAGQALAFGQSRGLAGSLPAAPYIRRAYAAGVSVSTIGTLAGLGAPGLGQGAPGINDLLGIIASRRGEGLRGSKAEQLLTAIATSTTSLAEQGISLHRDAIAEFMQGTQRTLGAGTVGMRFGGLLQGLGGVPGQARASILGPFGALTQAAILSSASAGATDLPSLLSGIESIGAGGPGAVLQIIQRTYGRGTLGALAAAGSAPNLPFGQMQALVGGYSPGDLRGIDGLPKFSPGFASMLIAGHQARKVDSMNPALAATIIGRVQRIEDALTGIDAKTGRIALIGEGFTDLVVTMIKAAETLGKVVDMMLGH